jgi:hypothetical protein
MKKMIVSMLAIVVLLTSVLTFTKVSFGAADNEYISEVKVVSAGSEDEAIKQLTESGYIPIRNNIAKEKPELASEFVFIGYRTTSDPSKDLGVSGAGSTGSVFGDSALMIGGIAMIVGVVVGMISMRVRPQGKTKGGGDK